MTPSRARILSLFSLLCLGTLALYLPVMFCGFVNYDDPIYVFNNPPVAVGLTGKGLSWCFQAGYASNWHPLTWFSHMVDCELFDLNPLWPHLENVGWHAVNAGLLFLLFVRLSGVIWRSALLAALFACHPLHVESVAWISERKDVLSTFLFLSTLLAYAESVNCTGRSARFFWMAAVVLFALGLMAKPMLVTLPFVLWLLDVWPLQRFSWRRGFLEKIPFFVLALGSSVLTVIAQRRGGALLSLQAVPWSQRISNADVSYFRYLEKLVWPADLSPIYPPNYSWGALEIAGALAFLLFFTVLFLWQRKRHPAGLLGWLWFLGTLVPVIGLVQVGEQAMADRYMYIPSIGLFLIVCWSFPKRWNCLVAGLMVVAIAVCCLLTGRQLLVWQDSGTLYRRVFTVTQNSAVAHANYGAYLRQFNQLEQARVEFETTLRLAPNYVWARNYLGRILFWQGKYSAAVPELRAALQLDPDLADAHYELGLIFATGQNTAEAIGHYREVLRLQPGHVDALNNLAWILAANARPEFRRGTEAVELASRACGLTGFKQPILIGTLAAAYAEAGRFPEAVQTAVQAQELAQAQGNPSLAAKNTELLRLYQAGRAYHEPPL